MYTDNNLGSWWGDSFQKVKRVVRATAASPLIMARRRILHPNESYSTFRNAYQQEMAPALKATRQAVPIVVAAVATYFGAGALVAKIAQAKAARDKAAGDAQAQAALDAQIATAQAQLDKMPLTAGADVGAQSAANAPSLTAWSPTYTKIAGGIALAGIVAAIALRGRK